MMLECRNAHAEGSLSSAAGKHRHTSVRQPRLSSSTGGGGSTGGVGAGGGGGSGGRGGESTGDSGVLALHCKFWCFSSLMACFQGSVGSSSGLVHNAVCRPVAGSGGWEALLLAAGRDAESLPAALVAALKQGKVGCCSAACTCLSDAVPQMDIESGSGAASIIDLDVTPQISVDVLKQYLHLEKNPLMRLLMKIPGAHTCACEFDHHRNTLLSIRDVPVYLSGPECSCWRHMQSLFAGFRDRLLADDSFIVKVRAAHDPLPVVKPSCMAIKAQVSL